MFDDLRAQFRKAVENFNEELNRNELSHNTNELVGSMKNQVTEAISHINVLALQISNAKA